MYISLLNLKIGWPLYLSEMTFFFIDYFQVDCVEELIKRAGVVAVPGCGFFQTNSSKDKHVEEDRSYQKRYIRFAFCKSDATLTSAAQKLNETNFEFLKMQWL